MRDGPAEQVIPSGLALPMFVEALVSFFFMVEEFSIEKIDQEKDTILVIVLADSKVVYFASDFVSMFHVQQIIEMQLVKFF